MTPTAAAAVARLAAWSTSASRLLSRVRSASRKLLKPARSASTRCLASTLRSTLRTDGSFRLTADDEWQRVLPHVFIQGPHDSPDPGELDGLVGHEALELPRGARQGSTRLVRRLEEALVAGDHKAAQPRFDVDDLLLERVGGHERLARLNPQLGRAPHVCAREDHHRESSAHDDRKQTARHDHSTSQPASHSEALRRR